jgi:Uma2 family endonuclease
MKLPKQNLLTLGEFYKLREGTEQLLEYIDGVVFMSPSPSTRHQRISGRLHAQLFNLMDNECEVFHAPFDIQLQKENSEDMAVVVPDLSVICDKTGLTEQNYIGVPTMIIEIISPSNQSHDLVFKLNLYLKFGVKEYWIVNPLLNTIQVYTLDQEDQYQQMDVAKEKGTIQSRVLPNFQVVLESLFK